MTLWIDFFTYVQYTAKGQNRQLDITVGPTVDKVLESEEGISLIAAFVVSKNTNIKTNSGGCTRSWSSNVE